MVLPPRNEKASDAMLSIGGHAPRRVRSPHDRRVSAIAGGELQTPATYGGKFQFSAVEWQQLRPLARLRRCQVLAGEAETLARGATARMKTLYLGMAIQWKLLGETIVLESRGTS